MQTSWITIWLKSNFTDRECLTSLQYSVKTPVKLNEIQCRKGKVPGSFIKKVVRGGCFKSSLRLHDSSITVKFLKLYLNNCEFIVLFKSSQ